MLYFVDLQTIFAMNHRHSALVAVFCFFAVVGSFLCRNTCFLIIFVVAVSAVMLVVKSYVARCCAATMTSSVGAFRNKSVGGGGGYSKTFLVSLCYLTSLPFVAIEPASSSCFIEWNLSPRCVQQHVMTCKWRQQKSTTSTTTTTTTKVEYHMNPVQVLKHISLFLFWFLILPQSNESKLWVVTPEGMHTHRNTRTCTMRMNICLLNSLIFFIFFFFNIQQERLLLLLITTWVYRSKECGNG